MFALYRYMIFSAYLLISSHTSFPLYDSSLADQLIQLSRVMSKPYMWTRGKLGRLYSPFIPGKFGQYENIFVEGLYRNLLAGELFSILFPAAIIGELAAGPRYLSYALRDEPYHLIQGGRAPKELGNKWTLMTLNICFLPAELPLLFGGVEPASERVAKIAALVKEKNPDLLCLYEAHEVDSTYALYEALRDDFAYFAIDIGNDFLEFNSGLFVASKYPIEKLRFKPFQYLGMQEEINKGYFTFNLVDKKAPFAKVYTTHLQPYRKESDENIRIDQIKEISKEIAADIGEGAAYPIILCGDFNVPWGTEEYSRTDIASLFYNSYGEKTLLIDEKSRTYSALLGDERWREVNTALLNPLGGSNKYFEIVDYTLVANGGKGLLVSTERVEAFDTERPDEALTDHNALFTTFTFEEG